VDAGAPEGFGRREQWVYSKTDPAEFFPLLRARLAKVFPAPLTLPPPPPAPGGGGDGDGGGGGAAGSAAHAAAPAAPPPGEAAPTDIFAAVFGGKMAHQFLGQGECSHATTREEGYLCVPVEVRRHATLEDSLAASVAGELLTGDNAYACDACGKRVNSLMRTCFAADAMPDTLVFNLKRFALNYETFNREKVLDRLVFPAELNMAPYTDAGLAAAAAAAAAAGGGEGGGVAPVAPCMYRLRGVTVHAGGAEGGHYYSFIQARPGDAAPSCGTGLDAVAASSLAVAAAHAPGSGAMADLLATVVGAHGISTPPPQQQKQAGDAYGSWFEFNDEVVTPFDAATEARRAEQWYGGEYRDSRNGGVVKRTTSAYMLWYERVYTPAAPGGASELARGASGSNGGLASPPALLLRGDSEADDADAGGPTVEGGDERAAVTRVMLLPAAAVEQREELAAWDVRRAATLDAGALYFLARTTVATCVAEARAAAAAGDADPAAAVALGEAVGRLADVAGAWCLGAAPHAPPTFFAATGQTVESFREASDLLPPCASDLVDQPPGWAVVQALESALVVEAAAAAPAPRAYRPRMAVVRGLAKQLLFPLTAGVGVRATPAHSLSEVISASAAGALAAGVAAPGLFGARTLTQRLLSVLAGVLGVTARPLLPCLPTTSGGALDADACVALLGLPPSLVLTSAAGGVLAAGAAEQQQVPAIPADVLLGTPPPSEGDGAPAGTSLAEVVAGAPHALPAARMLDAVLQVLLSALFAAIPWAPQLTAASVLLRQLAAATPMATVLLARHHALELVVHLAEHVLVPTALTCLDGSAAGGTQLSHLFGDLPVYLQAVAGVRGGVSITTTDLLFALLSHLACSHTVPHDVVPPDVVPWLPAVVVRAGIAAGGTTPYLSVIEAHTAGRTTSPFATVYSLPWEDAAAGGGGGGQVAATCSWRPALPRSVGAAMLGDGGWLRYHFSRVCQADTALFYQHVCYGNPAASVRVANRGLTATLTTPARRSGFQSVEGAVAAGWLSSLLVQALSADGLAWLRLAAALWWVEPYRLAPPDEAARAANTTAHWFSGWRHTSSALPASVAALLHHAGPVPWYYILHAANCRALRTVPVHAAPAYATVTLPDDIATSAAGGGGGGGGGGAAAVATAAAAAAAAAGVADDGLRVPAIPIRWCRSGLLSTMWDDMEGVLEEAGAGRIAAPAFAVTVSNLPNSYMWDRLMLLAAAVHQVADESLQGPPGLWLLSLPTCEALVPDVRSLFAVAQLRYGAALPAYNANAAWVDAQNRATILLSRFPPSRPTGGAAHLSPRPIHPPFVTSLQRTRAAAAVVDSDSGSSTDDDDDDDDDNNGGDGGGGDGGGGDGGGGGGGGVGAAGDALQSRPSVAAAAAATAGECEDDAMLGGGGGGGGYASNTSIEVAPDRHAKQLAVRGLLQLDGGGGGGGGGRGGGGCGDAVSISDGDTEMEEPAFAVQLVELPTAGEVAVSVGVAAGGGEGDGACCTAAALLGAAAAQRLAVDTVRTLFEPLECIIVAVRLPWQVLLAALPPDVTLHLPRAGLLSRQWLLGVAAARAAALDASMPVLGVVGDVLVDRTSLGVVYARAATALAADVEVQELLVCFAAALSDPASATSRALALTQQPIDEQLQWVVDLQGQQTPSQDIALAYGALVVWLLVVQAARSAAATSTTVS